MKKSYIKPRGLYAVTGADRVTAPALVLDNTLWDRVPGVSGVTFRPAPEGSLWSSTMDRDSGARRGILTVLARPGTKPTKAMLANLTQLATKAEGLNVPSGGESAVEELQKFIVEPLILDVVPVSKVVMVWSKYATGERLHSCPECSTLAALNAASRLRAHPDKTGAPCIRSNTALTEEERNSEQ